MAVITAFVAGLALTPAAAAVARRLGIVDRPGPLKVHSRPVPYLGGLAVLLAALPGIALSRPVLAAPLALALVVGTLDDVRGLRPSTRLASASVVGLLAAAVIPAGWTGQLLAAVAVVVLVNAVNLLDGLDGLAGGVATASFAALAALVPSETRDTALAFCGATVAFCLFNRPPARIYLGDGGAWVVGTALALLVAVAVEDHGAAGVAAVPLTVALPLTDTAATVVRRALARRPLFSGDRGHTYDRLVDRGWSAVRVSAGFFLAQAVLGAVAVAAAHAPGAAAAALATAAAAVVAIAVVQTGLLGRAGVEGRS